jgi:hypothetical protein
VTPNFADMPYVDVAELPILDPALADGRTERLLGCRHLEWARAPDGRMVVTVWQAVVKWRADGTAGLWRMRDVTCNAGWDGE